MRVEDLYTWINSKNNYGGISSTMCDPQNERSYRLNAT